MSAWPGDGPIPGPDRLPGHRRRDHGPGWRFAQPHHQVAPGRFALHAPAAGWGEDDLHPDFVDKAAVLVVRLTKNHPLPDGNKRAAWVALRLFVEINGWKWADYPSIDESEIAMIAVASGQWDEARTAEWLGRRLAPEDGS